MEDLFGYGRGEIGDPGLRWVLAERWAEGPTLGCIGMNPSHASAERTDMTWTRWGGFARRWGFGAMIAVNPNPCRSASPAEAADFLRRARDGDVAARDALASNSLYASRHAAEPDLWLCGWGDKGQAFDKILPVVSDLLVTLQAGGARAFAAFGLTASGAPIHVGARGKARLSDDAPLFAFDPATRLLGSRVAFSWSRS